MSRSGSFDTYDRVAYNDGGDITVIKPYFERLL